MRRPFLSFERRNAVPSGNPLRLERLEDRLALSHGPLPLPFESVIVSPFEPHVDDHVANSAYTTSASALGIPSVGPSEASRVVGFPASSIAGAAVAWAPNFSATLPPTAHLVSDTSLRVLDTQVVITVFEFFEEDLGGASRGSEMHGDSDMHPAETAARPDVSAIGFAAYLDSHVAHPGDAIQAALVDAEHHSNQSPSAVPFGTEALIRASQTANATGPDGKTPIHILPTLPPPAALPTTGGIDLGLSRNQSPLALIPQFGLDSAESPNSSHLPSESQPGTTSSTARSADVGSQQSRGDSNVFRLSSGDSVEDAVSAMASAGNRAVLLASLPFNMDAVDRALVAMMGEVEGLGGELIMWMDDASVPSWAFAATLAVCGVGGRYVWRKRGSRSQQEESEEESSSWLFTRLQSPAGQP